MTLLRELRLDLPLDRFLTLPLLALVVGALMFVEPAAGQTAQPTEYPAYPSETPAKFETAAASFDYIRRDVMIPMRDGVKLHTVILVPKGAKGAPILFTRTPYKADDLTGHAASAHLGPILSGYDNATEVIVEGGYIRVVQDIRGKYGSEGDYVMTRPLHGPRADRARCRPALLGPLPFQHPLQFARSPTHVRAPQFQHRPLDLVPRLIRMPLRRPPQIR
jgi:hypothetical protein